ncbi:MAG: histone deacetylase family protein [Myxococcaceae bacterium]
MLFRRPLRVVHHEYYRLPFSGMEAVSGMEPRRADYVAWYLLEKGLLRRADVLRPEVATFTELGRVHTPAYLESLGRPETLAAIYAVSPAEIPADALLETLRVACGGTLLAAREALAKPGPVINLLGGFHHAQTDKGSGFCALNDLAIALATLRSEGFNGRAVVIDVDAHPPDGTANCLAKDPNVWIGSLSGSDWGPLPNVDEVLLAPGTGDVPYLKALRGLLSRMPRTALAFVVAGADVRAGDRLGQLALSEGGVRKRDALIAGALRGVPSVWLPAGGYGKSAWRTLAGTALVLARRPYKRISPDDNPLTAQFGRRARHLQAAQLQGTELELTAADLEADLHQGAGGEQRLLGYYTRHGIEYALYTYGLLAAVGRLGYSRLRTELSTSGSGDRFTLFGTAWGNEHVLVDATLQRRHLNGAECLFVNWLNLRHPRAAFTEARPALPGQDVPGLGLLPEAAEMLSLIAKRLSLSTVAFRPAWYHLAFAAKKRAQFLDPARQGRFEALLRDVAHLPLAEATQAVADGRVMLDGLPYAWEAEEMVLRPAENTPEHDQALLKEKERVNFTLAGGP